MIQCVHCGQSNSALALHCHQCGHLLKAATSDVVSEPFSPYQLLDVAGTGGMGVVYRAYDPKLCRQVALKVLKNAAVSRHQTDAQIEEARVLSQLNHPHIVTVFDISRSGSQHYIVTEWLEGRTLEQRLAEGEMALEEICRLAVQMASGIQAAHQAGIIHRDLKPSNVMILDNDGQVKMLDFGMASRQQAQTRLDQNIIDADTESQLHTTQGGIKGTLPYLAPELLQDNGAATVASDIFSFGIMLYQMCYAKHPFLRLTARQTTEAIRQHQQLDFPTHPKIPARLQQLIQACLEPTPAQRPVSMAVLQQELESLQQKLQRKRRFGWFYPFTLPPVFTAMLLFGLLLSVWLGQQTVGRDDVLASGRSLAVLPFENIGADPAAAALISGLSLSLTHDLSALGEVNQNVWVLPRSEVMQLQSTDLQEVHQTFGIDLVLQGTVQHLGQSRRLLLSIVDAKHRKIIRSQELELPLQDWLGAQQLVRQTVIALLAWQSPPRLEEQLSKGLGISDPAYQHYLTGVSLLYRLDYQDNLDQAITHLQQAVHQQPNFKQALIELGEAYLAKARYKDFSEGYPLALEANQQLQQRYPEDVEVQLQYAQILRWQTKYQDAEQVYHKIIKAQPKHAKAWLGFARLEEIRGNTAAAEQAYLQSLAGHEHWLIHNQLATFYYRTGQLDKAMQSYDRLHQLSPNNDQVLQTLGAIQFARTQIDAAKHTFLQAIAIKPSAINYSNLATVLFYQKKYADAVQYFSLAVELDDNNFLLWANLADSYRWNGQSEKAQNSYQTALQLVETRLKVAKDGRRLRLRQALYLAKSGQSHRAVQLVQGLGEMTDNPMRLMAAQIFEIAGERAKALAQLQQAIQHGYLPQSIAEEPEFTKLWQQHQADLQSEKTPAI